MVCGSPAITGGPPHSSLIEQGRNNRAEIPLPHRGLGHSIARPPHPPPIWGDPHRTLRRSSKGGTTEPRSRCHTGSLRLRHRSSSASSADRATDEEACRDPADALKVSDSRIARPAHPPLIERGRNDRDEIPLPHRKSPATASLDHHTLRRSSKGGTTEPRSRHVRTGVCITDLSNRRRVTTLLADRAREERPRRDPVATLEVSATATLDQRFLRRSQCESGGAASAVVGFFTPGFWLFR